MRWPSLSLVEAPPGLDVENGRADEVRIVARACGSEGPLAPMHEGTIEGGGRRHLPVEAGCYDLEAVRADGEAVGRQYDVRVRRPVEWRIE
ncbi:MAG: hypothetical protein M5U28_50825 [Sandaracinaceae bacterium]|nr:hypothetical protein [Sandaracinaceae bacterium]